MLNMFQTSAVVPRAACDAFTCVQMLHILNWSNAWKLKHRWQLRLLFYSCLLCILCAAGDSVLHGACGHSARHVPPVERGKGCSQQLQPRDI
jgi:hypothetical protein